MLARCGPKEASSSARRSSDMGLLPWQLAKDCKTDAPCLLSSAAVQRCGCVVWARQLVAKLFKNSWGLYRICPRATREGLAERKKIVRLVFSPLLLLFGVPIVVFFFCFLCFCCGVVV